MVRESLHVESKKVGTDAGREVGEAGGRDAGHRGLLRRRGHARKHWLEADAPGGGGDAGAVAGSDGVRSVGAHCGGCSDPWTRERWHKKKTAGRGHRTEPRERERDSTATL